MFRLFLSSLPVLLIIIGSFAIIYFSSNSKDECLLRDKMTSVKILLTFIVFIVVSIFVNTIK